MMSSRWLAVLTLALTAAPCLGAAAPWQALPLVPCASDGQQGPLPGPDLTASTPRLAPALATRLAYYAVSQGDGDVSGVIGPRGWHCAYLYGSSGDLYLLSPEPLAADPSRKTSLKGPAIQIGWSMGTTSGRFEAAELAAPLFPSAHDFVASVIAEGIEPAGSFPTKPYPTDRLTYLSPTEVFYETPGGRRGLGTRSWLAPTAQPIRGFVGFYPDNEYSVLHIAIRLPPVLRDLEPAILRQARWVR